MPRPNPAIALLAFVLAGCANDAGFAPHRDAGMFNGVVSGPVSAPAASTPTSRVAAPAAGTESGGILGGPVGASLDERDRQRAYAAEMQALELGEPGEPTGWRGERGRYGTIVPGANYEKSGVRCRDYTHTIYIDGRPQIARTTACRNPDGTWSPVG